jgi:hypothetical protein
VIAAAAAADRVTAVKSPTPPRRGILDSFRGLAWWELLLVLLPFGLVVLGGLVGGVFGAIAILTNLVIARRPYSSRRKAAMMIGIVVLAYLIVYVIATLIYRARHPA